MELPAVRSLHLDDAYMQNIHVLARATWLPQLRSLRIRDTHRFALRHLVGARGLAGLVELRIETNMLVSELVELASATHFDQLQHLEVAIGYSDDSAVAAFARAKGFAKLERFVVRGKLNDDLVARLRARWGDILTIER
jgi:hypothetical protein